MATITLELPDEVVDHLQARGLAQAEIEVIIVRWLREFVEEGAGPAAPASWGDGSAFARQLIAGNRDLFTQLAAL